MQSTGRKLWNMILISGLRQFRQLGTPNVNHVYCLCRRYFSVDFSNIMSNILGYYTIDTEIYLTLLTS